MESSSTLRQYALSNLRKALNNDSATFRDGQWEAIEAIVQHRAKLLVVQRTGWGKSIVYFLATKILRDKGAGPTLLVSPLLSLMRNQIDAAERIGIRAESINSTNSDDWNDIIETLLADNIDILLISPERLANEYFVNNVLNKIAPRVGLFVVDEAHCISDWGHDFRPDYMRIARVVKALPPGTPALATTATANNRVVGDIITQIGSNMDVVRGPLIRHSLRLQNINMPDPAARMAWLAENLPKIPGSGIIYTLTVRDAERLSEWLRHKGIDALAYHADSSERPDLEQKLLNNEVKALVATVALGMGFDKPDLGLVIHFQRPASVVHYYQQVGRAGRAVDCAYGILMGGSEDDEIAEYFIKNAYPPAAHVNEILQALEQAQNGLSLYQLLAKLNLTKDQIYKVLTILSVHSPSPITKYGSKYFRTATPFSISTTKIDLLIERKKAEQARMQEYMQTNNCLMEFLSRELDDPHASKCGICSSCVGTPLISPDYDIRLAAEASAFLRRSDIIIKPRVMWPYEMQEEQFRGRIPMELKPEPGRALCTWGDAGWGDLIKKGKQIDGNFSNELVEAVMEMVRSRWKPYPEPNWLTCVPSLNNKFLVPDLAHRISKALGLKFSPCVEKVRETPPQKTMNNSNQQLNNIKDAFTINEKLILPGPVFLVDDMADSGWTFTIISAMLRKKGCDEVYPLALAKVQV